MNDDPYSVLLARWSVICATQEGIIEFAKAAAALLAEAGRASEKAVGDPAELAVREWNAVILKEALRILREDPEGKHGRKLEGRIQRQREPRRLRHGNAGDAGGVEDG